MKEKRSYKRATFFVEEPLLDKLHDYAYTERLSLKEVINLILEDFLKDKTELLRRREAC